MTSLKVNASYTLNKSRYQSDINKLYIAGGICNTQIEKTE